MADNNKLLSVWVTRPKSCSFKSMGDNGIIIRLEGYPISYIRITMNRKGQYYSLLVKDTDGWVYRIKKVTELGSLFENNTRMILEEVLRT